MSKAPTSHWSRICLWAIVLVGLSSLCAGCRNQPDTTQQGATTGAASPTPTAQAATTPAAVGAAPVGQAPAAAPKAQGTPAPPAAQAPARPAAQAPAQDHAKAVAPTPAPTPTPLVIPAGTSLKVRTSSTLSTKSAQTGERFVASLESPLSVGGQVVAKPGAAVSGMVVSTDPGGRVKGVASISVHLTSLTLANGKAVNISTGTVERQAKSTKKKDVARIGIGAGAGAAIGAIAGGGKGAAIGAGVGGGAGTAATLATHGDPAVIPGESLLTFSLRSAVTVK